MTLGWTINIVHSGEMGSWTTPFSVVGLTRVPLGFPSMDGHDLRQFHSFRLIGRSRIEELHGTHIEFDCIIASYHDDLCVMGCLEASHN